MGKLQPEPVCEPEEVTTANLGDAVAHWEKSVGSIAVGFDCSDEYTHDLFSRDILHGVLHGFESKNLAVPEELKARIDEADKRFVELTYEIKNHVWGNFDEYDKACFWYYYRWPLK